MLEDRGPGRKLVVGHHDKLWKILSQQMVTKGRGERRVPVATSVDRHDNTRSRADGVWSTGTLIDPIYTSAARGGHRYDDRVLTRTIRLGVRR
jgi:hypothetical protein